MKILFEDYKYDPQEAPYLEGIDVIELRDGGVKFPHVGYYYDRSVETIFILPKVFIDKGGRAFGKYDPASLLDLSDDNKEFSSRDRAFLFGLSTWIYQAIALYNHRHPDNEITSYLSLGGVDDYRGGNDATLLDHIIALLKFNKKHQSLFTYVTTIIHSGRHKVNWTKTIRTTNPLLKGKIPYYLDCKTKDKTINYEEELICLFYSTLNYLREHYYFVVKCPFNYKVEKPHRIANLIENGKGTRRLRKIRGKYFTDELVQLWNLLFAFYERAERVARREIRNERLLVRNFNIVFEDMIDCLIGESNLPRGLKEQKDGKIIDHIYRDKSFIDGQEVYFIGDSKYYKEDGYIGVNSRYKQITYAKNVIQYNIDIFNCRQNGGYLRYRDELTEGYNPTPNFFIRGFVDPDDLSYHNKNLQQEEDERHYNYHFRNRLFDRDTLLVLTYKINFLFVLSAYVLSRGYDTNLSTSLRATFREDIIFAYQEKYSFYEVVLNGVASEEFIEKNFKKLIGKIYQTNEGKLILALERNPSESSDFITTLEHYKDKVSLEDLSLK